VPKEFETELLNYPKIEIQRIYKSVCFIGATGSGKSQSCNTICGKDYFEASANMNSHTYETKGILAHWFGDPNNDKIFVIDTPGLGDSQGRDTKHIANMVCAIQQIEYIHSFVITINSQNPRVDDNLKGMLRIFERMFGNGFFANSIFLFTRW
jgi:predicted GTPase